MIGKMNRWGLIASILAVFLLLGTSQAVAQDAGGAQTELNKLHDKGMDLYRNGDLVGAKKVLTEFKQKAVEQGVELNVDVAKEVNDALVDIEAKQALGKATADQVKRLDGAKKKYGDAKTLMANGDYAGAATLLKAVTADLNALEAEGIEVGVNDRRNVVQAIDICNLKLTAPVEEPKRFGTVSDADLKAADTGGMGDDTGLFRKALTEDSIRLALAEREVNTMLVDARLFLDENDFRQAKGKLYSAQLKVKFGEYPKAFKTKWLKEIQARIDLTAKKEENYKATLKAIRETEAHRLIEQDVAQMKRRLAEQKDQLEEQFQFFIQNSEYGDALVILDRIGQLVPGDKSIAIRRHDVQRKQLNKRSAKVALLKRFEKSRQFVGINSQMIPWFPITVYPENWRELTEKRLRGQSTAAVADTPADRKVRSKLEETIVSFNFQEQPVADALDFLQTLGGVNIVIDKSKLEDPDQTVTLKLDNVKLATGITLLVEQLGMDYVIRDGIVFISDEEGVKQPPVTETYDVKDLLADVPNFVGPSFDLASLSSQSSTGGGGGGGGAGIFGDEDDDDDIEGGDSEESMSDLLDLIQQVVEPGTWDEGSGNAIRGRGGLIIVTHSPDVQREVEKLMASLRKTRALQVSVDIRFITIRDSFLESIGVDWVANDASATLNGLTYDRAVHGHHTSYLGDIVNDAGGGMGLSTTVLTGDGGLTLAASFLDDLEVNVLLTAVQQSEKATLLQAPKLTMMNGQRAFIAVSRQINFIEDVSVEVSELAVGYDPEIGTVQDGIVFDVRPTVSADRRYVQMDLRPSIAVVEEIDEFEVVTPGFFGGVIIQLPRVAVTVVRTTVSIPDGGTLLIGGLTYAFDNEVESGIPILSKIPLLGRFFSRRGFATEKQNIVILVKPTIIIAEELEEEHK